MSKPQNDSANPENNGGNPAEQASSQDETTASLNEALKAGGFASRVRPGRVPPAASSSSAAAGGGSQEASGPSAEELLLQKDEEIAGLKDRLLRTMADSENLRSRTKQQVEDAGKYAVSKFAQEMIQVQENLYRALESIPEDKRDETPLLKQIYDGVEMTRKELEGCFTKFGITRVFPLHEPFDHRFHQAIAQVPNEEHPNNTVLQVVQAGYVLQDRLLRPAMVAVSKSAAPKPQASETPAGGEGKAPEDE